MANNSGGSKSTVPQTEQVGQSESNMVTNSDSHNFEDDLTYIAPFETMSQVKSVMSSEVSSDVSSEVSSEDSSELSDDSRSYSSDEDRSVSSDDSYEAYLSGNRTFTSKDLRQRRKILQKLIRTAEGAEEYANEKRLKVLRELEKLKKYEQEFLSRE